MSDRATGRHRASHRASTPLSSLSTNLTTVVTDHVGALGRTGVVVAMSSGLVATMGLQADAATQTGRDTTASLPAVPAAPAELTLVAEPASVLAAGADLLSGAPVSAPAKATVHFESASFTAVPKKVAPKPRKAPQHTSRAEARASRSAVRTELPSTKAPSRPGGSFGSARGSSVLAIAARYVGIAYRYGGTTPRGFDCSGYTKYVFGQLGVSLPRTADQQMRATRRISRSEARAGDLVFMLSGGHAYHVGIYAGGGTMYDSPRTGKSISKRSIWSSNVVFGRV